MGCSASVHVPVAACYLIDPQFQQVRGKFDALNLTDHNVATLHTKYIARVPGKSEVITVESALDIFGYGTSQDLSCCCLIYLLLFYTGTRITCS
jgi:hypothetical protein